MFPYNQSGCSIHKEPGILNLLLFSKHLNNVIKRQQKSVLHFRVTLIVRAATDKVTSKSPDGVCFHFSNIALACLVLRKIEKSR